MRELNEPLCIAEQRRENGVVFAIDRQEYFSAASLEPDHCDCLHCFGRLEPQVCQFCSRSECGRLSSRFWRVRSTFIVKVRTGESMKTVLNFMKREWQVPLALGIMLLIGSVQSAQADVLGANGLSCYAPGSAISGEFVLGPTSPGKWGSPVFGTGATVTWSLMPSGVSVEDGPTSTSTALSAFMPVGFHAQIVAAFAAWSSVADITFIEVADDGAAYDAATTSGDIRIAGTNLGSPGGVLAHGYYPPTNSFTAAGDIHFDTNDTWILGSGGGGFNIFQVAAHEIGHAIGLDHTGVPLSLMNPVYTEAFFGPQADDIAGAVFIYGAPQSTAVPEPGSIVLLLTAVLALGWRARRQRLAAVA